jgi:hypothetical protein
MLIPNLIYKAGGACPLHSRNYHGSINCLVIRIRISSGYRRPFWKGPTKREKETKDEEDDNED